jgi:winged helix-turn-helix protein
LAGPAPEEDRWSGRTVAEWMSARLGRPVSRYRGWIYLNRLKPRPHHGVPRPRHALANPAEQEDFKKS